MELKEKNIISELCNTIKSGDDYKKYVQLKEYVDTNETSAYFIKRYHELQFKLLLNEEDEHSNTKYQDEFKKVMSIIQSDEMMLQYLMAEYKMNNHVSDMLQTITDELNLSFLNKSNHSDMV